MDLSAERYADSITAIVFMAASSASVSGWSFGDSIDSAKELSVSFMQSVLLT